MTIELRAHRESECELTLTHEDLPASAVDRHRLGWKAHLRMLHRHLEEPRE